MKKEDLTPFYQRHQWLIPIIGCFLLLISPVLVPAMILWAERHEFAKGYAEIFDVIRYRSEKEAS